MFSRKAVVSPNLRMHPSSTTSQSEMSIVTHPLNPDVVLAGANAAHISISALSQGWYHTTDGGATWSGGDTLPTHTNLNLYMSDPAVEIDLDGNLFFNALLYGGTSDLVVARSTDNGSSWSQTAVPDPPADKDKNHLAVDVNPASPYANYLYTAYTDFAPTPSPAKVSRSTNGGVSFSSPVAISGTIGSYFAQGVNLAIGPNGEVYATWSGYDSWPPPVTTRLGFNKSTDGGTSWQTAQSIRPVNDLRGELNKGGNSIRVSSFPSMAVDRSGGPRNGWIYIVYPAKNPTTPDIFLVRSTDGGSTWSTPRQVNQDASGKDQWYPWVAVDPATGHLYIVYYDSRNFPANDSAQVYISSSTDGGDTFEDVLVSDMAFLPTPIPGLATGYMGDYIGISALNGVVWPCWNDNRTGIHQAYTARIVFVEIGSPPKISVSPDTLDFGKVFLGYPETLSVSIRNLGFPNTLLVSNIVSDNGDFTPEVTALTLPGGSSRKVKVGFNPSGVGPVAANLTISSNDTAHPAVAVVLKGEGLVAPDISVSPDSFKVDLFTGEVKVETLIVSNSAGGSDLNFKISIGGLSTTPPVSSAKVYPLNISEGAAGLRNFGNGHPGLSEEQIALMLKRSGILDGPVTISGPTETGGPITTTFTDPGQIVRASMNPSAANGMDVAIVGAPADPSWNNDVQSKLLGTGQFSSVTIINAGVVTPTLLELQAFDAVLVFSDAGFQNSILLGDVLADYIDGGGGVVAAVFATASVPIGGRFNSANYWAIAPSDQTQGTREFLGTIYQPSHPILNGVTRFNGGSSSYRQSSFAIANGATRIADWTDGRALVATKVINRVNRADLGFYPPSSDSRGDFWEAQSDGGLLMANALLWVAGVSNFLSVNPDSGTVPAGDSKAVEVIFDATGIPGGHFFANLLVSSKDPDEPVDTVPAHLHVIGAPNIVLSKDTLNFGDVFITYPDTLTLTVSNNGTDLLEVKGMSIDNPRFSLLDAPVFNVPPGDSQARRVQFLPLAVGPDSGALSIASTDSTDPVVHVRLLGNGIHFPVMSVSPDSFSFTLNEGDSTTGTLTITNSGLGTLTFSIKNDFLFSGAAFVQNAGLPLSKTAPRERASDGMGLFSAPRYIGDVRSAGIPFGNLPSSPGGVMRTNSFPTAGDTVRVFVVRSFGTSFPDPINTWTYLNTNFSLFGSRPIRIDYTTLNISPVTYTDLVNSGAQVLLLSDAWNPSQPYGSLSLAEIGAIKQYVDGGRGLIVTSGTLNTASQPNHNHLAPLLGLDSTVIYQWGTNILNFLQTPHPVFDSIPYPYIPGLAYACVATGGWGNALRGGERIANSTPSDTGAIVAFHNRLYLSHIPEVGSNSSDLQFLYNSMVWAGGGGDWLFEQPDTGTVPPGGSAEVAAKVKTDQLDGGTFRANILVSGNDPANRPDTVPVRLKVIGTPNIVLSKDTLDFGNVFINYADTLTLIVSNNGSDLLEVSGMTLDNPRFSLLNPAVFNVPPGDSQAVRVQFLPTGVGLETGVLSIVSTDSTDPTVYVKFLGNGIIPPDISISPDSLAARLLPGETVTETLTVANTGGSDLKFDVLIEGVATAQPLLLKGGVSSIAVEAHSAKEEEAITIRGVQRKLLSSGRSTAESSFGSPVKSPGIIPNRPGRILGGNLLPVAQLVTSFPDYSGNADPMGVAFDGKYYWVIGGGYPSGQVAQLNSDFSLVTTKDVGLDCRSIFYRPTDGEVYIKGYTSNGLFRLHTSPFDGSYDVIFTGIFQDYQSKVCLSKDGKYLFDHLNGTVRKYDFATGNLLNTITLNLQHDLSWPRGNLLAHSGDYLLTLANNTVYAYDPATGAFVASSGLPGVNVSEWSMAYANGLFFVTDAAESIWYAFRIDAGAAGWLGANPTSATVPAGSSTDVEVTFNSTGLNIGGDYFARILTSSNDPDEPVDTAPVHLHVFGAPKIVLSVDTLDFGGVFIGYPETLTLTVSNHGTDVLEVGGMTPDNPRFSVVDSTVFDVPPGSSQNVRVEFAPTVAGLQTGTISIASTDSINPTVHVLLFGNGIHAPAMTVRPDSFAFTVRSGDSAGSVLMIGNTGLGTLQFELQAELGSGPPTGTGGRSRSAGLEQVSASRADKPVPWNWTAPNGGSNFSGRPALSLASSACGIPLPLLVRDSVGDGRGVDIREIRGQIAADHISFQLLFASPIDPLHFGGVLGLDTDQNPLTGIPLPIPAPGNDVGCEYLVGFFSLEKNLVDLFNSSGSLVGSFAVAVDSSCFSFDLPLSALGNDDGWLNLAAVVLTDIQPVGDAIPNTGHGVLQYNWLSLNPYTGTALPGESLGVEIKAMAGPLPLGSYRANIRITGNAPGRPVETVPVRLAVRCAAARGDLNGDGFLSGADVVLELNCVFLADQACSLCSADLNCDSQLAPADIVFELNAVYLRIDFPC